MSEESPYTNNNLNFVIGLVDDKTGGVVQLESGDIAWSNFVVRYGYVGTLGYLIFIWDWPGSFLSIEKDKLSLVLLLYMLLILGFSLTSDILYQVSRNVFVLMLFDFIINKKNGMKKITVLTSLYKCQKISSRIFRLGTSDR